jgi:hypothetical protein
MACWLTQKLKIAEWGAIQFRVDMLRHALDDPLHVAMLLRRGAEDEPDEVFVLVPDASFLSNFPGFAAIDETFIPTGLDLIVGPGIEFEKRFPEIAAKVRRTTK